MSTRLFRANSAVVILVPELETPIVVKIRVGPWVEDANRAGNLVVALNERKLIPDEAATVQWCDIHY